VPDPLTFFDKGKREKEGPQKFVELLQEIGPTLADIICGGVLDRFPRLRLVSCEHEVSWLPYLMFRLDQIQKDFSFAFAVKLKKRASDYVREHVWSTMIDDPFSISLRHIVGVDRIMWSSDFPHPRCAYLNTHKILDELLHDVPLEEGQKIVEGNVAALYQLG
jgi:predicted TIM-barrel fold metal-dependent hydrolase